MLDGRAVKRDSQTSGKCQPEASGFKGVKLLIYTPVYPFNIFLMMVIGTLLLCSIVKWVSSPLNPHGPWKLATIVLAKVSITVPGLDVGLILIRIGY